MPFASRVPFAVLGRPAVVDVVVAREHHVDAGSVHELPQVEVHGGLGAAVRPRVVRIDELLPRTPVERRVMLERQGARGVAVGGQVGREPLVLWRARAAARVVAADGRSSARRHARLPRSNE